jgi:hypothetical protein
MQATHACLAASHTPDAQSPSTQHSPPSAVAPPPGAMQAPPQQVLPGAHGAVTGSHVAQVWLTVLQARPVGLVWPSQAVFVVRLGQHSLAARQIFPSVGSAQHGSPPQSLAVVQA